ncbi:MAG: hypothetical protein ABIO78_06570, partial [Thermoanaerobaculia bacterium]
MSRRGGERLAEAIDWLSGVLVSERSSSGRPGWTLAIAALALYAAYLISRASFAAGGPDSSGYLNAARLFESGRTRVVITPLRHLGIDSSFAGAFVPLGFALGPRSGTMVPTYPPGLPIHFVAAAKVGGWTRGPFVVSPLAAAGCMMMMFAVGRQFGLSHALATVGAVTLGFVPALVVHALQPVSDVVATFWALVTIWCAMRAQSRPGYAAFAGVAFAVGVWVRPT